MKIEEIITDEAQAFIIANENVDASRLLFNANKYDRLNIPLLVDQIKSKLKAKAKLPFWYKQNNIVYPPPLSMEQCSSEATADYKARLMQGENLLDITGGAGVDLSYLARNFNKSDYVERQSFLVDCFQHNKNILGLTNCNCSVGDGVDFLKSSLDDAYDWIYVDPARRDNEKNKVIALQDCEPNVAEIQDELLQKSMCVMVKLSPMLDIQYSLSKLNNVYAVYVIAVHNECKELLLLMKRGYKKEPKIFTVNLGKEKVDEFSFYRGEEKENEVTYDQLKTYLYEPNSAIMKAGAFKSLANSFELFKIGENTHLYTADKLLDEFPGKVYQINDFYAPNKKKIIQRLKGKKISVKTRNYPSSADAIRKKYKFKDGDDLHVFFCKVLKENLLVETNRIK